MDIHDLVRTDYKEVDKRDGIHAVMGWVRGDTDTLPIVTDHGKPFGLVNDRALMGRKLDHHAKIEPYTLTTRALPPTATVDEVIERMAEYRAAHLPVANDGKLLGYVSVVDLLREVGVDRTAGDLCVPVRVLREDQTLGEALHAFNQEYVDHLPVADGKGRVMAVLPRRRVIIMGDNALARGRKDAVGNKFRYIDDPIHGFTDAAVTLPPNATAEEILEAVEDFGYVLVKEKSGDRLVGIITPETLARSVPKPLNPLE